MKAALRLAPLLAISLALPACVSAPAEPAPAPAPASSARPTPAPSPAPAVSGFLSDTWIDAAVTPGQWRYEAILGGSAATFLGQDNTALARLRCERGRKTMFLTLPSNAARSPVAEIRTETEAGALPLRMGEGPPEATMPGDLALLDAMALSKGKFAIGAQGMPPLYLPSHAEVSRVIEDCR